jgi:hypothetical protein
MKPLIFAAILAVGTSFAAAQMAPPDQRQAEHQQERASGINDQVDVIAGPSVGQVTANTAILNWTTNKTAATRVNYGLDPNNLYQHAYLPGGSTEHQVVLRHLRPHTTYYFEVENKFGQNRLTGTFTTQ